MANAIFQNEPAAVPQSSLARGNAAAPAVATHRFTARTTVWTTTLGFFFFCVFATCGVALSTENAGFSTVAVSAMDSKEYYQYQLLMATTAVEHDNNDDEDWDLFGSYYNENSSHQCSSSAWEKVCCLAHCNNYYYSSSSPNDKPLWWLVLQWMKMMLFKMLRTYHAKPVILIIGPLLMGLLVGYWLGLQQPLETRQESTKIMTKSKDTTAEKGTSVSAPTLLSTRIRVALKAALDGSSIVCAHILVFIGILWNCVYIRQKTDLAEIYIGPSDRSSSTVRSAPSNGAAVKSIDEGSHNTDDLLEEREANVRTNLKSDRGIFQESGVPESQVPKHVAVIMDGNRRYGKSKYGSASRGHWEGSSKLVEFAKWCLAEKVQVLTVFAFSSENWNRDPVEVASLMQIFAKYCDELRIEAVKKDIKLVVLSTDQEKVRKTSCLHTFGHSTFLRLCSPLPCFAFRRFQLMFDKVPKECRTTHNTVNP